MDHSHLRLFDPQGTEHDEPRSPHSTTKQFTAAERATSDRIGSGRTQPTAAHDNKPSVAYSRVIGEARVAVSVGDLLPLLAEAWQSKRAWLGDFSSDRVIVSQDLYEVLLAYKRLNKAG